MWAFGVPILHQTRTSVSFIGTFSFPFHQQKQTETQTQAHADHTHTHKPLPLAVLLAMLSSNFLFLRPSRVQCVPGWLSPALEVALILVLIL